MANFEITSKDTDFFSILLFALCRYRFQCLKLDKLSLNDFAFLAHSSDSKRTESCRY